MPGRVTRRALLRTVVLLCLGGLFPFRNALLWCAGDIGSRPLEVIRIRVRIPHLPPAFAGTTIAQISDLHYGEFLSLEEVRAVVDVVLGLHPDIVAVTGDHATHLVEEHIDALARELSRLRAPFGVYSVYGNHDYWPHNLTTRAMLERAELTLLDNSGARVVRQKQTIYIAGIDDALVGTPDLLQALSDVPADGRAILLAHEPDYADRVSGEPRVALQLSGHSHGGQIRLPLVGPVGRTQMGRKYPAGLRQIRSLWLYTNRGIGTVSVPIRFNCPPEVTLIELVGA